jgi:hypothetical protein
VRTVLRRHELREALRNFLPVALGQLYLERAHVVLEIANSLRAGDGHNVFAVGEQVDGWRRRQPTWAGCDITAKCPNQPPQAEEAAKTSMFVIPFTENVHGEPRHAACRGSLLLLTLEPGEILRFACLPCLPAGGRRRAQNDNGPVERVPLEASLRP